MGTKAKMEIDRANQIYPVLWVREDCVFAGNTCKRTLSEWIDIDDFIGAEGGLTPTQFMVIVEPYDDDNDITLKNFGGEFGAIATIEEVSKNEYGTTEVSLLVTRRAKIEKPLQVDFPLAKIAFLSYQEGDVTQSKLTKQLAISLIKGSSDLFNDFGLGDGYLLYGDAVKESSAPVDLFNQLAEYLPNVEKEYYIRFNNINEMAVYVTARLKEYIADKRELDKIDELIDRRTHNKDRLELLKSKARIIKEQIEEYGSQKNHDSDDDGDGGYSSDAAAMRSYLKKINELKASEEIKKKLRTELKRMSQMSSSVSEYNTLGNYFEFVLTLPWGNKTADETNLSKAEEVLNEDHYGIKDVKDRIIEFLAVKILSNEKFAKKTSAEKEEQLKADSYKKGGRGSVLCLIGPPGVGKTSIAKSVARAMNKAYAHMSLGGVRDECEIRGHRRTYVAALPGRILTELAKAGSSNPVFVLDEVDKLCVGNSGDPSAALLEALDPSQNSHFRDNYLALEYDLSDVMFICTANYIDNIKSPLLDRMEVIDMTSYLREEKFQIAKRYLVDKQIENCGLVKEDVKFTDDALYEIIDGYTREAGVRELERKIGAALRKVAVKTVENRSLNVSVTTSKTSKKTTTIDKDSIVSYLGQIKYKDNETRPNTAGEATGLAVTSAGGDTLKIEVVIMDGKGELTLTGQLGDVMQESAHTALSYLRANAGRYNIDVRLFNSKDIHIHIPDGAVPKDGPSAGITMCLALYSALTGEVVKDSVAMTGEMTLHGNVLPIGGLKEKSLAALRKGFKTVIMPKDNEGDLAEIKADGLEFKPVSRFDEVLALAIKCTIKRANKNKLPFNKAAATEDTE